VVLSLGRNVAASLVAPAPHHYIRPVYNKDFQNILKKNLSICQKGEGMIVKSSRVVIVVVVFLLGQY